MLDLRRTREREQQGVGLEVPGGTGNVAAGADDVDSVEVEPSLGWIVVEEGHRVEIGVRILEQCIADLFTCFAGTEDQGPVLPWVGRAAANLDDESSRIADTKRSEELVGTCREHGTQRDEVRSADKNDDKERRGGGEGG